MRAVVAVFALLAGCAELGVVTDGSSISYGRPNRGRLVDGVKLPDHGPGYTTGKIWRERGNRYGTDELVHLLKSVGKRMKKKSKDARLVVADLSGNGGGAAHAFHRSHQSGRDVDLLYYMRDAEGKALEPEVMIVVDTKLVAKDGSGATLDVSRNWQLVKELLTSQEAYVQYIFMYKPVVEKLLEHATKIGEPPELVARAFKAMKQPGDSAPHNDHMHVRIYCAPTDRMFGCVDIGPLELLAERETEAQQALETIAGVADPDGEGETALLEKSAADVWNETAPPSSSALSAASAASLSSLLNSTLHH